VHRRNEEARFLHENFEQQACHFSERPFSFLDIEGLLYLSMPVTVIQEESQQQIKKEYCTKINMVHLNHNAIIRIVFIYKTIVKKQP
jgi:hypothetical protein